MRRNMFVFGSVSGILAGALMGISLWANKSHDSTVGMVLGYAAMIIALSLIYVGVRNFRDKYNDGIISFGKAMRLALGITLIASTIYVLVWLVEYYVFVPDFMDQYAAAHIRQAKSAGLSPAELQRQLAEIDNMRAAYRNPVLVILFTYLEIVPVGVIISLLTALLLKRKQRRSPAPEAVA